MRRWSTRHIKIGGFHTTPRVTVAHADARSSCSHVAAAAQRSHDGLATLQLYTAGSHGDVVSLPGLAHEDALEMRETIRAHIKRESL